MTEAHTHSSNQDGNYIINQRALGWKKSGTSAALCVVSTEIYGQAKMIGLIERGWCWPALCVHPALCAHHNDILCEKRERKKLETANLE